MTEEQRVDYVYTNNNPSHTHAYLWGRVLAVLQGSGHQRVFDLGCGNGALARWLEEFGFDVTGVDPSELAIAHARTVDTAARIEIGGAYEPLHERFGRFPVVTSLEVVEHVYYPRKFAHCVAELLEPKGLAIISTPYHGYAKNVALALSGKMDSHFTALWDHGHIKFWSVRTLTQLFSEQGMSCEHVYRVGRLPLLAKSMILVFRKP